MRRLTALALVLLLGLFTLLLFVQGGTRYATDYGRWRVIVLQSDDWGLEAWFPDAESAESLSNTLDGLPARLRPYATSTLESAAEVDSLASFLASMRDADGLPVILQANTVVASIDPVAPVAQRAAPDYGFALRAPGAPGSAYGRDDLWQAYDRARAAGVWRLELHGLTHRDLAAYADAWGGEDPLLHRAANLGVVAHAGWRRRHELAHGDSERSRRTLAEAVQRFEEFAGHAPTSFIAPDYHWDDEDEAALRDLGIGVIQAKAEQLHPRWAGGGFLGRIRKRLAQMQQRRSGDFLYMDRSARLEPYGIPSVGASQGAGQAAAAVRAAWRRGEPGIVSIHRVQLIHPDADIAGAGRAQLAALFEELGGVESLRFLVDAEVLSMERDGVSSLDRGANRIYRNFGTQPRSTRMLDGRTRVLKPGSTVLPREE
jgi:hypothetical protein